MRSINAGWLAVLLVFLHMSVGLCEADTPEIVYTTRTYEELGFSILVPEGWQEHNMFELVTFDEVDLEIIGSLPDMFTAFSSDAQNWAVNLTCWRSKLPGDAEIAELERDFGDEGTWKILDGNRVYLYSLKKSDMCGAYLFMEDVVFCVGGSPGSDLTYAEIIDTMLTSITVVENAALTGEEH